MATHSSILAWRYPWAEDPCRLQSMGLQRVGHNWATRHTQSNLLGFIFSKLLFPNYLFPINFQKHPLTGKIIRKMFLPLWTTCSLWDNNEKQRIFHVGGSLVLFPLFLTLSHERQGENRRISFTVSLNISIFIVF